MAVTYSLYCKECYSKLKELNPKCSMNSRVYKSYFICSNCGFETDRGYAVQVSSPSELQRELDKKQPENQAAFSRTF